MQDHVSIANLLTSLEPRLRETRHSPHADPEAMRSLLDEAARALQAAAGELRQAREALVAERLSARSPSTGGEGEALARFVAAAPDAVIVTDGGGTIRHANAAAGSLLGVRRDDLDGARIEGFAADAAAVGEVLSAAKDGGSVRRELRLRPRRRPPVRVEVSAWRCDGGAVAWAMRAPAEPRPPATGFAAPGPGSVLDALPVATVAMDLDGTVLSWNRAAERLLGWTEDEITGCANPAVGEELLHRLDGLRAVGPEADPFRAVAEVERKDGSPVKLELWVAPMDDGAGEVTGTVAAMRLQPDSAASAAGADRQPWTPDELRRVLFRSGRPGDFLDQVRGGVTAGLHFGHLRAGDRLPSIREAAQTADADHRVVSAAYQRLAADGLVEVRNRRGVMVADIPRTRGPVLGETAEWLARVLEEASALQVRVPHLPDLVRRWTAAARLQCVCVDATEDARTALAHEMSHQWGMRAVAVAAAEGADPAARHAMAEAFRGADLVVTTTFHAHSVRPVADALGVPMVVATANPDVVASIEAAFRRGPVTAVLADTSYGDRLRALEGGDRLVVIAAGDGDAVAALDPAEPVVATLAALRLLSRPLRLLVPAGHFVSPVSARAIARVLIRSNIDAGRQLQE